MFNPRFWSKLFVCVLLARTSLTAQVNTGTISGTVTDSTRAVIPGTEVTIRLVETGTTRTLITNERGIYVAPQLAPGSYEVSASLQGFQTQVRTGTTLTVGREAVVDFTLEVGSVSERVEVTGEAPMVETQTARAAAPVDLTGYWVSVVTEDWRFRMISPRKGDYNSVPLSTEGLRVANMWDPAKDEAAGEQCKSYGAAGLMRVPGRLHITWEDDNTLRIDTEAGSQTRLFHFDRSRPAAQPTWQSHSESQWEFAGGRAGRGTRGGNLKVVTTAMRPGYLRKNGVPYSGNATLTEYYNRLDESNGDSWLVITTMVDDPQYLQQLFVTSTHFKKLSGTAEWKPEPCSAR